MSGSLGYKTRVLERCVLERKHEPKANASVLGTLRFRKLRSSRDGIEDECRVWRSRLQHAVNTPNQE